jgi:hypothetical protein
MLGTNHKVAAEILKLRRVYTFCENVSQLLKRRNKLQKQLTASNILSCEVDINFHMRDDEVKV